MDISKLSIKGIQKGYEAKEFTPEEVFSAFRSAALEQNDNLNAYFEVFDFSDTSQGGALSGVPIAVKDNILMEGRKATASSKVLENYHAPYSATAIEKLKKEGAVFLGRTNMDEFAMGSSTENSAFGVVKNPLDVSRVPGGSSGGSAAAVASHSVPIALGSDTGGSIRQPAAFCGVVGLKPTYGAVSRYGLIALGSSLDQIGPLTHTVEDAEVVFDIMKGQDPRDATSLPDSVWEKTVKSPKVIGVPWDLVEQEGIDDDVLENFKASLEMLKNGGYTIKDIELPSARHALAVYYIILPAEISSNLARYDGVKFGLHVDGRDLAEDYFKTRGSGFGKEVRRRIMLGTHVLSSGYYDAYYYKANEVKRVITREFIEAFKSVDAIVTPTTPTPAFKIGEKAQDPLQMYLADVFTVPANIAGIPALSVPSGTVERDGVSLPLGLHIQAPHTYEKTLFQVGKNFESLQE